MSTKGNKYDANDDHQDNSPEEVISSLSIPEQFSGSSPDDQIYESPSTPSGELINLADQAEFTQNAQNELMIDVNYQSISDTNTQSLENYEKSYMQLLEKYNKQSEELKSVKESLYKLEESTKFKFENLVQEAIKEDCLSCDEDNEECKKYINLVKLWQSKTEDLYSSMSSAINACCDRIIQCGELMEQINGENPSLYNRLNDRYQGIELIKRMLERLRDPLELLKKSSLPSEHLFRLEEQDLVYLLRSEIDEREVKKILTKKLKETGDTRYKSIREWRDLAEKSEKQWLNFIEKKLLPALDGINNGKPYADHLVDDLINSYKIQSYQEKLSIWLQTYTDLENILLETLKSLGVEQMRVVLGQPVDYDRHEPIGTEPDSNLPHESIKEITRNGYEYKLPDQDQSLILRSVQVLVVKNK